MNRKLWPFAARVIAIGAGLLSSATATSPSSARGELEVT